MSFVSLGSRSTLDSIFRRQLLHHARCRIVLNQTACLTSLKTMEIQGRAPIKVKPWPYEKITYNMFYQFFDRTTKRMHESSKVVVVDGPPGVGKTALAKSLAKEFDLKYIPDVTDKEVFISPIGEDTKPLDEYMPVESRRCSFEEFYTQSASEIQLSRIAMTQRDLFICRFYRYCEGLCHLLNTGQGVVMERGVHSDIVFTKTLAQMQYIKRPAYKFFVNAHRDAPYYLHRPHVYIYIDASVEYIQEAIKKRNIPWEVNSPVLTEKFLSVLNNNCRNILDINLQESQSEVLVYDAAQFPDIEMIIEDIEKLDLEFHDSLLDGFSDKFLDWGSMIDDDDWNEYRIKVSNPEHSFRDLIDNLNCPRAAKELYFDADETVAYNKIVSDPEI